MRREKSKYIKYYQLIGVIICTTRQKKHSDIKKKVINQN